ncbi:FUSC family protein [Micromonospora sp. M12]
MGRFSGLRTAGGRLRHGWRPVVEATLAATVAWLLATRLLGHPQPFFAPAAALIVLGQARGQRIRRAVEVVLGVAAGVLVADLVVQALGRAAPGRSSPSSCSPSCSRWPSVPPV